MKEYVSVWCNTYRTYKTYTRICFSWEVSKLQFQDLTEWCMHQRFKKVIITLGSCALNLLFLLQRHTGILDLIISIGKWYGTKVEKIVSLTRSEKCLKMIHLIYPVNQVLLRFKIDINFKCVLSNWKWKFYRSSGAKIKLENIDVLLVFDKDLDHNKIFLINLLVM